MGIRSLIFPTCKELAERLSSGSYERAPWPARLAVKLHLVRCELCRIYARQVRLVGDAYRQASEKDAPPPGLKDRLKDKLR
jgi:hypothetical protein